MAGPSFGFLSRFAWRDLFEERAAGTTKVCWGTWALLTALILVVLALPLIGEQVRRHSLKPLSRCLWVDDGPGGRKLRPEHVEALRQQIPAALANPRDFLGCYPFYISPFKWTARTPEGQEELLEKPGRTLAPGDPFLASIALRPGHRAFDTADQEGVIVTPRLLLLLGLPVTTPPGTLLSLTALSGNQVKVPLVAVTAEETLPLGHLFIMNESYEQKVRATDPDVAMEEVYTRPVPDTWPTPDQLGKDVPQVLELLEKISKPPRLHKRTGLPAQWILRSPDAPGPLASEWQNYLRRINELMQDAHFPKAEHFEEVDVPPDAKVNLPERQGHDRASVYVRDYDALDPAATAIRVAGWPVDNEAGPKLKEFAEAAQAELGVLSVVLVVVAIIAILNLMVLQELRLRPKVPEIGMLRAMGMKDWHLQSMFTLEAALLWVLGFASGLIIAAAVGLIALVWVDRETLTAVFQGRWFLGVLIYLILSPLVCWYSTMRATAAARNDSPAYSLQK